MKALVLSELRQRLRGKRWWVLLLLWTAALFLLTWMVKWAVDSANEFSGGEDLRVGAVMFGSYALFVLGLACLILPALTATAINGERDRGTLAILQATMYRPHEIIGAKFASGFITAAGFIVASVPVAIWSAFEGGVGLARALAVYLILFLVSAVLVALALAASAIVRRVALSVLVAYGLVAVLTIGTPILFAVSLMGAPRQDPFGTPTVGFRWLILAPNPFVVLADAAPRVGGGESVDEPLEGIREIVEYSVDPEASFSEEESGTFVWPAGATILVLITTVGVFAAVDRLRVPARKLAPGQRIA